MSSAAIVTLVGNVNYGNRLQNFALQEVISGMGFTKVQTIAGLDEVESRVAREFWKLRVGGLPLVRHSLARRIRRPQRPGHDTHSHILSDRRQRAIADFTKSHIDEYHCASLSDARALAHRIDLFVAGSDQIWIPGLPELPSFLTFAHPQQRIAYAASFGVPRVPDYYRKVFQSGIRGMNHVSVRENNGADIVHELIGADVPVVLDPTMLLAPVTWAELAVQPKDLNDYVAAFFLGMPNATEMTPIYEHASRTGCEIIDLKRETRFNFDEMGPFEFIGAIRHAKLLVTDSYHAAIFAMIFEVPFLLKGRGSMNSRFDTLLAKSGLNWPLWRTRRELEASIDVDWGAVRGNLARERSDSLIFLRNALLGPHNSEVAE